jgi:hypothetical protein
LAVNLAVWFRYLAIRPQTETFRRAVAVLRSRPYQWWIVAVGHCVPAAMLLVGLFFPGLAATAAVLAGISIVIGGVVTKNALITKAAFVVDLFENFGAGSRPAHEIPEEQSSGEARAA